MLLPLTPASPPTSISLRFTVSYVELVHNLNPPRTFIFPHHLFGTTFHSVEWSNYDDEGKTLAIQLGWVLVMGVY